MCLLGIMLVQQVKAQYTTYTQEFASMDGKGGGLKIVSVYNDYDEYDVKTTIYVKLTDGTWGQVELLGGTMENGDMNLDIRYQSRVSNLKMWMEDNGVLTRTWEDDGSIRKYARLD